MFGLCNHLGYTVLKGQMINFLFNSCYVGYNFIGGIVYITYIHKKNSN